MKKIFFLGNNRLIFHLEILNNYIVLLIVIKIWNKNIKVVNIRGNIDTRIKKVESGQYDGAILALAGLKVLNLEKYAKEIFSLKD